MSVMGDPSMNTNMHRAFQREIPRLQRGLQRANLADARQREGLAARYKFFSDTRHHHPEGEDIYLFATIRGDANVDEVAVLDAMEAEHTALVTVLGRLDREFANLSADSDKTSISADLDELLRELSAHGDHEEREGVPIIQKYFTESNYKDFLKFNRSAPTASLVFPWMCDGADEKITAQTWGVIPAPVRLFLKPTMTRKYNKFTTQCGV